MPRDFKPCEGSCLTQKGDFIEVKDEGVLCQMGFLVQLAQDAVLVISEPHTGYKVHAGGSKVTPDILKSGKMLKPGQSTQEPRRLQPGNQINLTPAAYRGTVFYRRHENIVDVIMDTITNVNGQAAVDNNEAELRAQAAAIEAEVRTAYEKSQQERKQRGKEVAQEVGKYLREECGFTYKQVGELFDAAGVSYARDAVSRARTKLKESERSSTVTDFEDRPYDGMDLDLMDYAYRSGGRGKNQAMIEAGADYIVSIGGVPADKNKK